MAPAQGMTDPQISHTPKPQPPHSLIHHPTNASPLPPQKTPQTSPQAMHYPAFEDLWQNVVILLAMFVCLMGLAFLALKRSHPL